MQKKHHLKLGTRTSLLAWTQSSQIKNALEALHPNLEVTLVGIKTQGDIIQDRPLHEMEGKDFFVRELDTSLLRGEVDFCVHSYKDLSLERPEGLHLAATTKREDPRDIIFFRRDIIERIKKQNTLRLGSSSPRRAENTPNTIMQLLPRGHSISHVQMTPIRGNVNSRLTKLLDETQQLDGIVLASAGITRLLRSPDSAKEIQPLLDGLPKILLPLSLCPTSPAQGALALECRKSDSETTRILASLIDVNTTHNVAQERLLMKKWGGGCHQRFGVTVVGTSDPETQIVFSRGVDDRGASIDGHSMKTRHYDFASLPKDVGWNGTCLKSTKVALKVKVSPQDIPKNIFIAHTDAFFLCNENFLNAKDLTKNIVVSGVKSWKKMAEAGFWVNACTDELGKDRLFELVESPLWGAGEKSQWVVLSQENASWDDLTLISTYRASYPEPQDEKILKKLKEARYVYWTCERQHDALSRFCRKDSLHFCGVGKTYQSLKAKNVFPILSSEEFDRLLLAKS